VNRQDPPFLKQEISQQSIIPVDKSFSPDPAQGCNIALAAVFRKQAYYLLLADSKMILQKKEKPSPQERNDQKRPVYRKHLTGMNN
jgi:hypothetical protein